MKKIICVILDGAAEPGKSAFAKAGMHYLDHLASHSHCGTWDGPSVGEKYNIRSLSEPGTLNILGYALSESPGRGYLEAIGLGLRPAEKDICIRANFATVDKRMRVVDRRAGFDDTGLEEMSKKLSMKIGSARIKFVRGVGHRGVVVVSGLRGMNITDSDSADGKIRPLDRESVKLSEILNSYVKTCHKILSAHPMNAKRKIKANYILLRSPGRKKHVKSFKARYGMKAMCISNDNFVKGVALFLGMKTFECPDDFKSRASLLLERMPDYDFLLLHIKEPDIFSHMKDFEGKVSTLGKIDSEIFSSIARARNSIIIVSSDHMTSSSTGMHMQGRVPLLVYTGGDGNGIKKFDELHCRNGFATDNPFRKIMALSSIR